MMIGLITLKLILKYHRHPNLAIRFASNKGGAFLKQIGPQPPSLEKKYVKHEYFFIIYLLNFDMTPS
jgi:hypothetical protein